MIALKWTKETVKEAILKFYDKNGRLPTKKSDFTIENNLPSVNKFKPIFDTYSVTEVIKLLEISNECNNIDKRILKLNFPSTRDKRGVILNIPPTFIDFLGITKEERTVEVTLENDKIIIKKYNNDK